MSYEYLAHFSWTFINEFRIPERYLNFIENQAFMHDRFEWKTIFIFSISLYKCLNHANSKLNRKKSDVWSNEVLIKLVQDSIITHMTL